MLMHISESQILAQTVTKQGLLVKAQLQEIKHECRCKALGGCSWKK